MHWVNLQMKLLWALIWCCFPFPRNWEKIRIFSDFFGLLKNRKHQLLLLFFGLLLKIVICMISDNRALQFSCHRKLTPVPNHRPFSLSTGCAHAGLLQRWHFLRRVWFYSEVNRMNTVTNTKNKTKRTATIKCFLETNTWLCPLQKQLEETGKPCALVLLLVTPLGHGQLLDVTGSGGAMWELVTILSQRLAVALIFLIN